MTTPRVLLVWVFLVGVLLAPASLLAAKTPTETVEQYLFQRKGGAKPDDAGPARATMEGDSLQVWSLGNERVEGRVARVDAVMDYRIQRNRKATFLLVFNNGSWAVRDAESQVLTTTKDPEAFYARVRQVVASQHVPNTTLENGDVNAPKVSNGARFRGAEPDASSITAVPTPTPTTAGSGNAAPAPPPGTPTPGPGTPAPAPPPSGTPAPPTAGTTAPPPVNATPPGVRARPLVLVSIFKPLVMLIVLIGWGWVVAKLDKDLAYYYLPRRIWNSGQIGVGVVAFMLWLVIPLFWIGFLLAVLLLAGGIFGYAMYRNTQVPEADRWRASLDSFRQRVEASQARQAQKSASITLLNADTSKMPVPSGQDPRVAPHQKLEELLDFALPRRGERVDVVVGGVQQVAMVVNVDGFKYAQPATDGKLAVALIDYVKDAAGLDTADRRKKQTGTLLVESAGQGRHKLGVTTWGSTRELSLTLRIDPDQRMALGLENMGLVEAQKNALGPILVQTKRAVLVACPPHHGMTTTLYSFLLQHDPYTHSVVTLEEEVALEIEGVQQKTYDSSADGESVNKQLQIFVRQDPAVLMLARLADASQAKTIAKAAPEMRVYAGMKAEDTFHALKVWTTGVGDPPTAARALAAIVSQRLVRKLCTTCRIPYKPDPEMLRKVNLPADKVGQFYKQSGKIVVKSNEETCPDCLGMGYRGRVAVFEVMALDDNARALIAKGDVDQLRAYLRSPAVKNRMLLLQEVALLRVIDGTTSISEITRVLAKSES